MIVDCVAVLLGKCISAIHFKAKGGTVIGHIVLNQIDIVDFRVSEFIAPLHCEVVNLLHIGHCAAPPINS